MWRDDFDQITYGGHESDGFVVVTQFSVLSLYVCPRFANVEPTFYAFLNNDVI
jgi:hypothetical protein